MRKEGGWLSQVGFLAVQCEFYSASVFLCLIKPYLGSKKWLEAPAATSGDINRVKSTL